MYSSAYEIVSAVCDLTGSTCFFSDRTDFLEQYEKSMKCISVICGFDAEYVLLGTRYCEQMLYSSDKQELYYRIKYFKDIGKKILFAFPPLHQSHEKIFCAMLEDIVFNINVDAIQLNDIGGLVLARKNVNTSVELYAGRLFDKTVREYRFDSNALKNQKENLDILSKPTVSSSEWQKILANLDVSRAETDTIPNGMLDLPDCKIMWDVIYPEILLSRTSNCEFQGICQKGCAVYRKEFYGSNERIMIKHDGAVCAKQLNPLHDSVSGKFRLVYSDIIRGDV